MNQIIQRAEKLRDNRWVVYTYCFTMVSLTAAAVYGWPSLRQALRREDEADGVANWSSETALGAAFTAGAYSTQGLRFFAGMARDRYGTAVVVFVCLVAVVLGAVGIAFADSPLTMGLALFCQGIGSGAQLSSQPVVAKLFPNHAGAVLASLSGASQVSGLVFLAVTKTFPNRQSGFLVYAVIVVGFAVLAIILLPGKPIATPTFHTRTASTESQPNGDKIQSEPSSPVSVVEQSRHQESRRDVTSRASRDNDFSDEATHGGDEKNATEYQEQSNNRDGYNPKKAGSAWTHVWTWKYLLLVQWFSFTITPLQYYVGSIGFQLEEKGDASGKYSELFTIMYGSTAILSPVGGYLADEYSLGLAQGLSTLLVTFSFFMLNSNATLPVQSIGLGCNAIGRMWIFGTFSAHVGRVFGYQHFGTLAGLGLLTSAVVSVLQYPLIAAAANGKADAMNWLSGSILAAEMVYCGWLHYHKI